MMSIFSTAKIYLIILLAALTIAGCGEAPAQPEVANRPQAAAESDVANLPVNVDAQTLESLRGRDDVIVLDVREDWEYSDGHISGAVHLPLNQIPDRLNEIPQDKTVIAVCRSGNRSNQATQFLRQQGFDNVHNMQGGMISWSQAGYQIAR